MYVRTDVPARSVATIPLLVVRSCNLPCVAVVTLVRSRHMEWQVLEDVPSEHVRDMLSISHRRTFKRDEVVFHHGDPAESLHLISKGRFAARIPTPLGRTAMVAIYGPGEAFGELALLPPGTRRSATVSALEPGETFSVLREDFFRLAGHHPGVKAVLLALLAEQIRRSDERIVVAHYLDAEARVRWALMKLAEVYGTEDEIVIPLIQEHVAEFAGAARATVNRVLSEEKDRGTVELERGRVRVLDLEAISRPIRRLVRS
jgi:CRP/FNR family transcriptional regulator, cyclic AMP receptor protein